MSDSIIQTSVGGAIYEGTRQTVPVTNNSGKAYLTSTTTSSPGFTRFENIGAGHQVYAGIDEFGVPRFKTIVSGAGVTVSETDLTVIISSTGSISNGGGSAPPGSFLSLSDAPPVYGNSANYAVTVNGAANGLAFTRLSTIATSGVLNDGTGTLGVNHGGTGAATLPLNGILVGNGIGTITSIPAPTVASTFLSWSGTSFVWNAVSGGSGGGTFGTTAGTYAQGNDSRFTTSLQKASNLSDLTSPSAARAALALATVASTGAYSDLLNAPAPASATPLASGVAAVGTSTSYARQDHVHPSDTTRAPINNPTFTGIVTIPVGANITGYALTSAIPQPATVAALALGSAAVGSSILYARQDHVHPNDTTRLAVANNLSDLASVVTARTNLGVAYGNIGGTVAQGNDPRFALISSAEQSANKGAANGYASLDGTGKVPTSQLPTVSSAGNIQSAVRTVTANTTVVSNDGLILVNPTGAVTLTLESSPATGVTHFIKDGNGTSATNNITINGNGVTIDGASTFVISQNRGSITLIYNGSEWSIV